MAKRRGRRDHSPIANDPLSVLTRPVSTPLRLIEDQRLYHPDGPYQPVRTVSGGVSHIISEVNRNVSRPGKSRSSPSAQGTKSRLIFSSDAADMGRMDPAIECVRRQRRREVLFAKGKGGSRHRRKVRRNARSAFGC